MLQYNGTKLSSLEAITYSNNKKSIERNFSWSFIGEIRGHRERQNAIDIFRAWSPHKVDAGMTPVDMRGIYNNSRFVLVGRGQVNLDCFRIYEAIINGAIPIVVGPEGEVSWVFQYEGHRPPLLFSDSFQNALIKAKSMNHSQVDFRREELMHWYVHRLHHIMNKVREAFLNGTSKA